MGNSKIILEEHNCPYRKIAYPLKAKDFEITNANLCDKKQNEVKAEKENEFKG